jgi:hypothetical protein
VRNPQELSGLQRQRRGVRGRGTADNSKHATSACRVNIFIAQIPGIWMCAIFLVFGKQQNLRFGDGHYYLNE